MNWLICLPLAVVLSSAACASAVDPHPDWTNSLKPGGEPGPQITLAEDGRTDYRIVIPSEPTSQEQKAADDLALWLAEMTGAQFEIVREDGRIHVDDEAISVGRTKLLASAGLNEATEDLGDEGYGIAVKGKTLFLFGGRKRGPINAVYALLEEDLGCRWYSTGTSTIPQAQTLEFRPVMRTFVPKLRRRDPYYSDAHDPVWSLRNRTATHAARVPAEWGGYPKFPMHFVHTYNLLMPPDEFFDAHPEYYAEIDGKRQPSQLCATNPDVARIVTERVLQRLRACPDCSYVDVSPNDWRSYCECAACKALDEAEGSKSASLLTLVNHVADAVAEEFPDVKVTTLAYLGTVMPPKTIRPLPNVEIVLCTDSHAWDFLLLTVNETEQFQNALKAWHRTGARVAIWDYAIDFARYMQPMPNMHVVAENMRTFVEHGAVSIMEQGSHGGNFGVDRARLRSWVWAKQMWDVNRDTDALIRDFYYGFYGAAAEPMYAYNQMLEERWKLAHDRWLEKHPLPTTPSREEYQSTFFPLAVDFDDDFIDKADSLFKQARELAADNKELQARIDYAYLPVLFLQADRGPGDDRESYLILVNEFERIARREHARFVKNPFGGPDLDRNLQMWRALALIDPDKVHFRMLDNRWRFKPDPDNVGVEQKWFAAELDCGDWGTVRSDLGHVGWEGQGYAEYGVGYGWYRQEFEAPEGFAELPNPRMFFGAVDEQAEIWINGELALRHTSDVLGLSKDFLWNKPFIFDPVKYMKPGKNVLAVRVKNEHLQGGIWKPVSLVWGEPVEDLHVLDEFIRRQAAKQ